LRIFGKNTVPASSQVHIECCMSALPILSAFTDEELKQVKPIPSTLINVEYLLNMCQDDSFIKSLGALGPGDRVLYFQGI
jgi:hypothetical protein